MADVLIINVKTGKETTRNFITAEKAERKINKAKLEIEQAEQTLRERYEKEKQVRDDLEYEKWKDEQ